jgi:hypothetical protein
MTMMFGGFGPVVLSPPAHDTSIRQVINDNRIAAVIARSALRGPVLFLIIGDFIGISVTLVYSIT